MAATDVDIWIPEEWDGPVIQKVMQSSAIEALARREPMATDTKHVPRSGDFGVAAVNKSGAYTEDESDVGQITLTARKIGKAMRIAEEDRADAAKLIDVIATKKLDWARNYAKYLDNATLAVTAAENNDMLLGRPFTSLYRAIVQGVSGPDYADVVYTPDANRLTATAAQFADGASVAGTTGYGKLSDLVAILEEGDYFEESELVAVAHPRFRRLLRGMIGSDGHPVIVPANGTVPETLMGYPVRWSLGAKTSAAASASPTGNPLVFVFNRQVATVLGERSGPESFAANAAAGGTGFLTDEDLVKMRSRRGFAVGDPNAAAVLEITG